MKRFTLPCVLSALCLLPSAYCAACPPVAISSIGVQAVCPSVVVGVQPQVAVQTFSLPQLSAQTTAILTVNNLEAVATVAPLQVACVQGACAQRAQRVGLLGRLLGSRSRSVARSVSVQR